MVLAVSGLTLSLELVVFDINCEYYIHNPWIAR